MWASLHCLYVDQVTLFERRPGYTLYMLNGLKFYIWIILQCLCGPVYNVYMLSSLRYLYGDQFKWLNVEKFEHFMYGQFYIVYMRFSLNCLYVEKYWSSSQRLCVDLFTIFIRRKFYILYNLAGLQCLYVEHFSHFICRPV